MTVLENPTANPGLALLIFRGLVFFEGEVSREKLLGQLGPPGAGDYQQKDGDARLATITFLTALGIASCTDETLTLELSKDDWRAADAVESFQKLINRCLMAAAVQDNPFARGVPAFLSAIAWLLAQDPLHPIERWNREKHGEGAERLQLQNLALSDRLIANETQWRSFTTWATFLGFAERIRVRTRPYRLELLAPDPTRAIHGILPAAGSYAAPRFFSDLASAIPVVDGGVIRRAVEAKWQGDQPPEAISPTLSVALLRLEAAGRIQLTNLPDSRVDDRVVLHTGTEDRIVSSIEVYADE